MTKQELINKLKKLKVLNQYELSGNLVLDRYVLSKDGVQWDFFDFDMRGNRYDIQSFISVEEAYDFIYKYALDQIKLNNWAKERGRLLSEHRKHIHTVVTQIPGEGFIMSKTDQVYIPPTKGKK